MEYRQLGNSGTRVSKLCLGTMNFGGSTDEPEAHRIIDTAIEGGINFIDTADVYGRGISEEFTGRALQANGKRDDIVLATKAVATMGDGTNDQGASRYHLTRAVDDCLRRLQTDRIDLFYLHITDITTPIDEIVDTLNVLVRQGKILYVGTSKWPVPLLMELLWKADIAGGPQVVAEQPPYNLTDRRAEMELVWTAQRYGLALVPFGPLAGGVLSGVYRKGQPIPEGHKFKEVARSVAGGVRAGVVRGASGHHIADHRPAHGRARRERPARGGDRADRRGDGAGGRDHPAGHGRDRLLHALQAHVQSRQRGRAAGAVLRGGRDARQGQVASNDCGSLQDGQDGKDDGHRRQTPVAVTVRA